jgi:hypothetical protein
LDMSDTESSGLIGLCESILEDGEVSVEEVRRLGQWIQENEAARRTWPGEVLTQPVQDVLLDGRVNKAELRKISVLLHRMQKEWAARWQEKVQQDAIARAASAANELDLSYAWLPSVPVTFQVMSHSERGVVYHVDLAGPSCDCPDWKSNRRTLPPGDLTRCCKHTFDAFGRVRPGTGWPGWLDAFLEQGWRPHPQTRWLVLEVSDRLVLASTAPIEWANVFAPSSAGYQRFGYSVAERRWSYGVEPDGAVQIAKAIHGGLTEQSEPTSSPVRGRGFVSMLRRVFGA